jgi:hypothetical protein
LSIDTFNVTLRIHVSVNRCVVGSLVSARLPRICAEGKSLPVCTSIFVDCVKKVEPREPIRTRIDARDSIHKGIVKADFDWWHEDIVLVPMVLIDEEGLSFGIILDERTSALDFSDELIGKLVLWQVIVLSGNITKHRR